jgi:hypothetical protein
MAKKKETKKTTTLNFLNLQATLYGGDEIKIAKSGIYFGPGSKKELGLSKGDFALVAELGGKIYVGKKPKGVFGGTRVRAGKNPDRPFIPFPKGGFTSKLKMGRYNLGPSVQAKLTNEQDQEVYADMFELQPM